MTENKDKLKPLSAEIQVCPKCGKIDAYRGDGHDCNAEITRQMNEDYGWDWRDCAWNVANLPADKRCNLCKLSPTMA